MMCFYLIEWIHDPKSANPKIEMAFVPYAVTWKVVIKYYTCLNFKIINNFLKHVLCLFAVTYIIMVTNTSTVVKSVNFVIM